MAASAPIRPHPFSTDQTALSITAAQSLVGVQPTPSLKPALGFTCQEPLKEEAKCTNRPDSITEQCTFTGVSKSGDAVVITTDG